MEYIIKSLRTALCVDGIVNLHYFEFPKDYETYPDSHPFSELICVSGGRVRVTSDGYTGELQSHEILIHRAGEKHSFRCAEEKGTTLIIIGFRCAENCLLPLSRHPVKLSAVDFGRLSEIVREGRNVFAPPYNVRLYNMRKKERQPFGAEQLLRNDIENFLILLLREAERKKKAKEGKGLPLGDILAYLNANIHEKVTIEELCFVFNTNRTVFCKGFREAMGMTCKEYLSKKRAEVICRELSESDTPVTLIADELGYDTVQAMSRFFRREMGCSPTEYRAGQQKNKKFTK